MKMERDIVIAMVKPGDTLEITPIDNLPNFDKKIKVQYKTDNAFIYNCSSTSDGNIYPFWAIKSLKIVKG